jgi:phage terminase large subunit GpA-like protein
MSKALRPPPNLTVSEWADSERRLSPEASAEPGRWYTSRAEYLRGIMDAVNDPSVRQVVVMSSAQVGKTEFILNILGYHIAHDPAPMLCIQPTLQMSQAFSKDRLAPMLRDTPCLKGKVKDPRSRDSGNTTLHKVFPNGHITIAGANSAAGLASRPVRIVLCDEVDRYPPSAGSEGDPVRLAVRRSQTFWNSKVITVSTPTVKGLSRIEAEYLQSDQRQFHVSCKDCGENQTLKWSNVRWDKDDPASAHYVCDGCGSIWSDADRFKAIKSGRWEAQNDTKGIAGFHLSGLYSPWITLEDAVGDFLEAKKLPETLKVWVNTFLGESWEDAGENLKHVDLRSNSFEDSKEIDDRIAVITAGIDTQDDRLEYELVGWGRDEESWSIGYGQIYGDLSTPAPWEDLDQVLKQKFITTAGRELPVRSACIDSGGHYTQAVYNFVRPRESRRVFAIKGMGGEQRPLVSRPTRNNIGKIRLFSIGTFPIKELLFSRFRITNEGPGFCHFPESRDDEYFAQLTDSEKIVTKYSKGYPRREFVKTRNRNEALDLRVYAYAALCILNVNINAVADRITHEKPSEQKPKAPRPHRRQQNFVNSWR